MKWIGKENQFMEMFALDCSGSKAQAKMHFLPMAIFLNCS